MSLSAMYDLDVLKCWINMIIALQSTMYMQDTGSKARMVLMYWSSKNS